MRISITGRNIDLTDGLKGAVEERLNRLEKYFTPETDVNVTLSVEKDRQKIEVTIPTKGHIIRSEQVSNDMYVSISLVEEAIERQLKNIEQSLYQRRWQQPRTSGSLSLRIRQRMRKKSKLSVQNVLM